jgi:hypothetical protein
MGALNNIIVLNRGDTHIFDLTIEDPNDLDGMYTLQGNDAVYVGVMDPGQRFEDALIKKKYTAANTDTMGNLSIEITPEDTLDLLPGKYFYSVKLHMLHDELDVTTGKPTGFIVDKVITIINKTKFIICD